MENIEYDINIYGDLMIIDKENENIKIITVPSIKRLFNEKQQLISFLEDKIKEYKKTEKYLYEEENTKLVEKARVMGIIGAYQEVLDFVNKGGKDE